MMVNPVCFSPSSTAYARTAVAGLIVMVAASCASGANYKLKTSVKMDSLHDSNIRLLEDDGPSAFGYTTSARFGLGVETGQWETSLDTRIAFLRFNHSALDSDDQDLSFQLRWRSERHEAALTSSWVRDSTLTSERLDSGRVGDASRRDSKLLQPSWTYSLSERNLLTLSGAYIDREYRDPTFVDYDYTQSSLRWTHLWNERLQLLLQAQYSDYQSAHLASGPFLQSHAQHSEDAGLQAGARYQWTENLTVTALIGRSHTEQRYDVKDPLGFCTTIFAPFMPLCQLQDSHSKLSTADATLAWNDERNQLAASLSRATQPSSDGQVLEVSQLHADWTHRLWRQGHLRAALTLGRHRPPERTHSLAGQTSEREFCYASLGYRHRLSESWALDTTYQYRYQDYQASPNSAESHVVSLGIRWEPPDRHWSR